MNPPPTTFRKKYNAWESDLIGYHVETDYSKGNQLYSDLQGKQTLDEIVPSPKRMRDKFNYQTLEDVKLWVDTPDMQEFANGLYAYRNRNELIKHVKNRALDRGFRVQLPYGIKNMTIYINCMKYKAPRPGFEHDEIEQIEAEMELEN